MARRSRKDMERERREKEEQATQERIFSVGIYARLSVENSGKSAEKEVITSQIDCCKEYIRENPDLSLTEIYVDNGATGTNFQRKGFQNMMNDVESGKIDCLLVRDLSRFGRNHLETGAFLENYFPQIGLRFISIAERYDNFDENNIGAMIPIHNMMNEWYSLDTSRKVSTALKIRMENGTFRLRNLPYGYKWSENKEDIIIDEAVVDYVKMIFQWKLEGVSIGQMMKSLDELNAPIPENRKYENGVWTGTSKEVKFWGKSTIIALLENPFYTGDLYLGKTERALYKGITPHRVYDKTRWHFFENTHTAIITKEDFIAVEEIMNKSKMKRQESMKKTKTERAKLIDLLSGKIFCSDCGKTLYFIRRKEVYHGKKMDNITWSAYYRCSTYARKLTPNCTPHQIQQKLLHEKILNTIKTQVKVATDYEALLKKLKNSTGEKSVRDRYNSQISSLTIKLNSLKKKREGLYGDYCSGVLDLDEYTFAKETYDNQHSELSSQLDEAQQRKKEFVAAMSSDNKWITLLKSVSKAKKLNQQLVNTVIDKVLIYHDGSIEVVFNYNDIFILMESGVKDVGGDIT